MKKSFGIDPTIDSFGQEMNWVCSLKQPFAASVAASPPAHETFVKEYLHRTDSDLQTFYRTLVFTGKGSMPKAVGTDTEVVAYVARTRGAIGYVSLDANTDGAKTLTVLGGFEARTMGLGS